MSDDVNNNENKGNSQISEVDQLNLTPTRDALLMYQYEV